MSKSIIRSEYKPIVDLFDKLTGKRSLQQVFYDSIEAFAISIQNAFAIGEQFSESQLPTTFRSWVVDSGLCTITP